MESLQVAPKPRKIVETRFFVQPLDAFRVGWNHQLQQCWDASSLLVQCVVDLKHKQRVSFLKARHEAVLRILATPSRSKG